MQKENIRKKVRQGYAKVAGQSQSCGCCGGIPPSEEAARKIGYSDDDLKAIPEGANLGLGCGNPVAMASLKAGETVIDLGSGAGIDCFLAASRVGSEGRVIGVDMTHEMLEKARATARKNKFKNVEFRLGEIENLPVADNTADIIISNCVINLSPDKRRVFAEAFRTLKPGGRLMVSDIVLLKELPPAVKKSVEAYVGCVAGASMKEEYLSDIRSAGFEDVRVIEETSFPMDDVCCDPTVESMTKSLDLSKKALMELGKTVLSVKVAAVKP